MAAEAFAAGALGLEERWGSDGTLLLVYAESERMSRVEAAIRGSAGSAARLGAPEPVPSVDWSEEWKAGLGPIVISPRLVVRPPFAGGEGEPGAHQVVIDPGRAFGTGAHASTRLALEWLDEERARLHGRASVLDVGTGSGVLALSALALGAGRAIGFDVDPDAVRAAASAASANGLRDGLLLYAGPIDALRAERFDVVVANLLKSELLPVLETIASHTASGGAVIVSGLLLAERQEVEEAGRRHGLRVAGVRGEHDDVGDHWVALLLTP